MQNQTLEAATKAIETAYETTKEIVEINASAMSSLLEKQLEVMGQALDFGVKQAKLLEQTKDLKSALAAQTELVGTAAEQAMENVRDVVKIANQTRQAYDDIFKEGVQQAVSAVKQKGARKAA